MDQAVSFPPKDKFSNADIATVYLEPGDAL